MIRLAIVIAIMCTSAYMSEKYEKYSTFFYVVAVVTYMLFVGLRTSYNDTTAYIASFQGAGSLTTFFNDPERTNIMHNPLHYGFMSFIRGWTSNYHVYFMLVAIIDAVLMVRFLKNHSSGFFAYAVLLFWAYGLGMLGAAAVKQITAMAVLTLAFDALVKKKWILFVIAVLIASLIHTYAILFLVLPFFRSKPGNWKTMLLIIGTAFVFFAFNRVISTVLDYVDELGKSVSEKEVFDNVRMNIFRVLVFSVPPVMMIAFRNRVIPQMNEEQRVLANMSIISLMFVVLGTVNGANMFGRLASYFVLGDICIFGWIIGVIFEKRSRNVILAISVALFGFFIWYDYRGIDNYGGYASISLWEFFKGLVKS